ncbi:hypothetical protein [Cupriavidus sp. CP313]
MAEREKVMQEAMATMHKTSGMAGPSGTRSSKEASKATAAQMRMCHDMKGQHMALMQEMMQAMMDTQGMGGGMGHAMGGGMMGK